MRDLPGGRRFTPVTSTISHMSSNTSTASPHDYQLNSPHVVSYPQSKYTPSIPSSSNGHLYASSPSSSFQNAQSIFLEEENRQLKSAVSSLKEKARKVDFLQQSLDHVQVMITNQQMRLLRTRPLIARMNKFVRNFVT